MTDLSNSYMDSNPDSINLEWYHHMKCWKRFCDEEKIRRQLRKEERGEGTSSKGLTSTDESHVEVEPVPKRKAELKCTGLCSCCNCTNAPDQITDENDLSDDDDDDCLFMQLDDDDTGFDGILEEQR